MKRVFVIRGFNTKADSKGHIVDFEKVHNELIAPALKACDLDGGTTAEVKDAGNIRADMFALILEADVVVCDITIHNANVFYELGIRHSLRKKHTILIKGEPSADTTPFDLSTDRYLKYPIADPVNALGELVTTLKASLATERETDSPIFLMLPTLTEANPADITVTPIDFIEEVDRAQAAGDKAWLRVIAEDVRGERFGLEGLRRVGRAQWDLKDWNGARTTWEQARKSRIDDIEANLALANIYERLYRADRRETLLESSNHAIRKVLDAENCSIAQRAEALALQGRNLKTLWRAGVEEAPDVDTARSRAIDIRALKAYRSYREAFDCDLNKFYPGLAALQMGVILLSLAKLPAWRNLFKGDEKQARRTGEDLEDDLPALSHVVRASVERARTQPSGEDPVWAEVAKADLLFLAMLKDGIEDTAALVQAYRDAIPPTRLFAWDASRGQLALFARLGLNSDVARAAINAFGGPDQHTPARHLVVFAGHAIDQPGAPARFPESAEARARELIADRIATLCAALKEGEELTVLASAAPGADILIHEVCGDLAVPTRLCLPMPPEAVAAKVFENADRWRARFHAVVEAHRKDMLQMADHAELPRWLQSRHDIDPWERGNRWVMQLAQTLGASRVTLLVLWDGKDDGHTRGGTAHLVRLAKAQGEFTIEEIDSKALLT